MQLRFRSCLFAGLYNPSGILYESPITKGIGNQDITCSILQSGGLVCLASLGGSCLHRGGSWCPGVPSLTIHRGLRILVNSDESIFKYFGKRHTSSIRKKDVIIFIYYHYLFLIGLLQIREFS